MDPNDSDPIPCPTCAYHLYDEDYNPDQCEICLGEQFIGLALARELSHSNNDSMMEDFNNDY